LKLDFPIRSCTIDLTERCNLRCKYCFTYGVGKRDLTFEQGKKTIDWLFRDEVSQADDISIDWWGGEPFLKFDLMRRLSDYVLEKAHKTRKRVMMGGTSNVTLWTPKVIDWMNNHNIYFLMSIDGVGAAQDTFRPMAGKKKSSWNVIKRRLPYIVSKIPFIKSRSSPAPATIHLFADSVKELYNTYKLKDQTFSPVFEMEWTDDKLKIAKEQLFALADFMIELAKKSERLAVKHFDDGAAKLETGSIKPEWPCGAGRFYVGIGVDGYIYPCHRFNKYDRPVSEKYCIGSIDEGITRPDLREPFLKFLDLAPPEKCKNCKWYGRTCNIGCYAINFDLTGSIFTPGENHCRWMEVQGEAIEYFYKKIKENNLPLPKPAFPQPQIGGMRMAGSCICNNMCYLEGTEREVKTVDWSTGFACQCYNTNYAGGLADQARQLTQEEMLKISPRPASQYELLQKLVNRLDEMQETNKQLLDVITKLASSLAEK